jgi:hypothetical protein
MGRELFELADFCQAKGWNAEALLRAETPGREGALRKRETELVHEASKKAEL